MSEKWLKACGKLPRCSPAGPSSSEKSPTWFAYPSIFSKRNRACLTSPARARHSTYQKVHVERTFASAQSVDPCVTRIAVDQAVILQPITDCFQGGEPAGVRRTDKTHEWHQQAGCVQCRASFALHKGALL